MNTQTAAQTVKNLAVGDNQDCGESVVVGRNESGYWVADNGDETDNLTAQEAVELVVEYTND
jgi:hypothetical protein